MQFRPQPHDALESRVAKELEGLGFLTDSAIYGFNASARKFARAFRPLGKVLEISRVTHGPAV
jgi:hypothetical protein